MGTGKSAVTIAVAGALFNDGKIKRLLIVCPKSIVGVWESEYEKFASYEHSLAILEGDTSQKISILKKIKEKGLQIAVVNYESCWRLETEISRI